MLVTVNINFMNTNTLFKYSKLLLTSFVVYSTIHLVFFNNEVENHHNTTKKYQLVKQCSIKNVTFNENTTCNDFEHLQTNYLNHIFTKLAFLCAWPLVVLYYLVWKLNREEYNTQAFRKVSLFMIGSYCLSLIFLSFDKQTVDFYPILKSKILGIVVTTSVLFLVLKRNAILVLFLSSLLCSLSFSPNYKMLLFAVLDFFQDKLYFLL